MKKLILFIPLIWIMACSPSKASKQADVDWARGIVWYQIFPERFRNATTANDPTPAEVPDAENMPGWQVNPWNNDWYELQPWELKKSDNFYDVIFTRRYGGDLLGVIEKLDYLKDLGIDGIYFNPLFEAPSLHKYDGASYHHIDDNFGPNPQEDRRRIAAANETADPATWIVTTADSTFFELLKQAHARGIKVVIDGVFNHTGDQFFAFKDLREKQQASQYTHWYDVIKWDDPATPQNEFDFKAWWGYKSLPELAEDENGIVTDPKNYIFAATRKWMDPNGDGDPSDGIDGWRLDVAEEVAMPFWVDWNAHVKSINPRAITVAEIWHDASKYIDAKAFDGTMNYPFARAAIAFFANQKYAIDGKEFAARLQNIESTYGPHTSGLLWNLMDSHDTDRLASQILNPDRRYDNRAGARDSADYNISKPGPEARKIQKQIAALQMTFPGAPMIYYGTEAGMWGGDDPDDRKPMLWEDITYADETRHPVKGKKRPADVNKFDAGLYQFYKKLIAIRHENPVLQIGSLKMMDKLLNNNVFAFMRELNGKQAVVMFNKSAKELSLPINIGSGFINAWTGESLPGGEKVEVPLAARGFCILVQK